MKEKAKCFDELFTYLFNEHPDLLLQCLISRVSPHYCAPISLFKEIFRSEVKEEEND